jgi:hypothetical protein
MKKYFLLLLLITSNIQAQWNISASMGLDFKSSSSFRDYVNTNFSLNGQQVSSFKSTVAFNLEMDYLLTKAFALGIEYNVQIDSYSSPFGAAGIYEIAYNLHRPSMLAYYIISGEGYQFKFGGGLGYRIAALSEKRISNTDYSASGFGVLLKAEGNTMLAKNFYALIGGSFRYDSIGEVANGSQKIINPSTQEALNLNSISFGVYLGITITF